MSKPPRPKPGWLAPLGWGLGAFVVVVVSIIAMHQGSREAAGLAAEMRAASAVGPEPR